MIETSAIPAYDTPQPYRVSANEYLRMIEAGLFQDSHVELVDGVLTEMAPSKTRHSELMVEVGRLLGNAYLGGGFRIFSDVITRFDVGNVRAPDLAVIDRDIGEREHLVPADILLAVEISDSSLTQDIGRKRIGYASADIRHYWVVDVEGRRVYCYADPQGIDYVEIQLFEFGKPMPVPGTDKAVTLI